MTRIPPMTDEQKALAVEWQRARHELGSLKEFCKRNGLGAKSVESYLTRHRDRNPFA